MLTGCWSPRGPGGRSCLYRRPERSRQRRWRRCSTGLPQSGGNGVLGLKTMTTVWRHVYCVYSAPPYCLSICKTGSKLGLKDLLLCPLHELMATVTAPHVHLTGLRHHRGLASLDAVRADTGARVVRSHSADLRQKSVYFNINVSLSLLFYKYPVPLLVTCLGIIKWTLQLTSSNRQSAAS